MSIRYVISLACVRISGKFLAIVRLRVFVKIKLLRVSEVAQLFSFFHFIKVLYL